jgi:hypothetical protein
MLRVCVRFLLLMFPWSCMWERWRAIARLGTSCPRVWGVVVGVRVSGMVWLRACEVVPGVLVAVVCIFISIGGVVRCVGITLCSFLLCPLCRILRIDVGGFLVPISVGIVGASMLRVVARLGIAVGHPSSTGPKTGQWLTAELTKQMERFEIQVFTDANVASC